MKVDSKWCLNSSEFVLNVVKIFLYSFALYFACELFCAYLKEKERIIEYKTYVQLGKFQNLSETMHNRDLLSDKLKNYHNELAIKINAIIDDTIVYHQPFDECIWSDIEDDYSALSETFNNSPKPIMKAKQDGSSGKEMKQGGTPPIYEIAKMAKELYETQRKTFNETLKEYKWRLIY